MASNCYRLINNLIRLQDSDTFYCSYNNAAFFATSGAPGLSGLNSSRSSEISRSDAIDLYRLNVMNFEWVRISARLFANVYSLIKYNFRPPVQTSSSIMSEV